jgi:Ohr subfamily peroxiredoxin
MSTTRIDQVLYTASTRTTDGRDGAGKSSDGALDVKLASPGTGRPGTNPEQLFAVGWSACFMGAMRHAAAARRIPFPPGVAVDAEVDLGRTGGAFLLGARLTIHAPGLAREDAIALAHDAHQTCPYSKATRGNVDVVIEVA